MDNEENKPKSPDYVGHCSPPKASQFQPGQSGNKKGRPKGVKNLKTDFAEESRERIRVTEAGKPRMLTKQRATMKALFNKAINGDTRAINIVLNMNMRLLGIEDGDASLAQLTEEDQAMLEFALDRLKKQQNEPK